jgi:DNA-binding transcriptional regulator LsrR (DeoR family)
VVGSGDPLRERDQLALLAAQRYYLHQVSTPDLADELQVSRSTVSRLIAHARAMGWVHIEVRNPFGPTTEVDEQVRRRFRLAHVGSVRSTTPVETLAAAAESAAGYLNGLVRDGSTVAVAWGTTAAAVSRAARPRPVPGCTVVQLNGGGTVNDVGGSFATDLVTNLARAWSARLEVFPVPAFFDHAETRELLWRERSIRRIVGVQARADLAVFSVGAVRADVPSQVHAGGYLSPADLDLLHRAGVVGDIGTVFFRADGSTGGIEFNARASGLPLDRLREVPTRLCVAVGTGKAEALAAALAGGYVTHLLADQDLLAEVARTPG